MKGCSHDDVARRAYELFLSRGGRHGADLDDWLQAERQLSDNGVQSRMSRPSPAKGRGQRTRKAR